jgi:hypothetical protein
MKEIITYTGVMPSILIMVSETDLNVTNITAPSREHLFEYCAFIFTHCGQNPEEYLDLITKNPDQDISLTEIIETEDPECPF